MKLDNDIITGNYGVFYVGKAKLVFVDNAGQKLGEGTEHNVSPLENFDLSESITLPDSTEKIQLCLYDENETLIDVLDELDLNATGITNNKEIHIKDFNLKQNYPNPFNPSTKIEYSIPHSAFISLKVYNLLGEEVTTLYEGIKNAGNYSVEFNGAGLSSGIYFYRLKAENYMDTKKFVLLK